MDCFATGLWDRHLKREMWGTHCDGDTDKLQVLRFAQDDTFSIGIILSGLP
jgi:hypothetical protein